METHFLNSSEYIKTRDLALECFGDCEDTNDYYESDVFDCRIAVLEEDGELYSMAQLKRFIAKFGEEEEPAWYLLYCCTKENKRGKGYFNKLLDFVLSSLKKEGAKFAFLIPVDKAVYSGHGFTNYWKFNESERDLLYADDGLYECAGLRLDGGKFEAPKYIKASDTIKGFHFEPFDENTTLKYFDWFSLRPNKCCDSIPVEYLFYSRIQEIKYCVIDNRCLILVDRSGDMPIASIPLCSENELAYYFKLQEKYFNEILKAPFVSVLADGEGVKLLKEVGVLDDYEIEESDSIFDYIYSADDLRTLKGRKYTKKRNRISKFKREFGDRWEYRTLGYEDREEIIEFLKEWDVKKIANLDAQDYVDEVEYTNKQLDSEETLEIDVQGAESILENEALLSKIKLGGIYVDGKLSAFSLGGYNSREKMAIIDIEKADPEMDGLYQLINQEFLIHEFPDAKIVNREDDVGLPGLRQAKMSYNPIAFDRKYNIIQKSK